MLLSFVILMHTDFPFVKQMPPPPPQEKEPCMYNTHVTTEKHAILYMKSTKFGVQKEELLLYLDT